MFDFNTPNLIDIEIESHVTGRVYVTGCLAIPPLAKKFKVSSLPMSVASFKKAYDQGVLSRLEADGSIVLRPITSTPTIYANKDVLDDSSLVLLGSDDQPSEVKTELPPSTNPFTSSDEDAPVVSTPADSNPFSDDTAIDSKKVKEVPNPTEPKLQVIGKKQPAKKN